MHNHPGVVDLNIRKLAVHPNFNVVYRCPLMGYIQLGLVYMFVYSPEKKRNLNN